MITYRMNEKVREEIADEISRGYICSAWPSEIADAILALPTIASALKLAEQLEGLEKKCEHADEWKINDTTAKFCLHQCKQEPPPCHGTGYVPAYCDPNHEGNSAKYHTGKSCIEPGCKNPAGTLWGIYWCFQHNVERLDRIDGQLRAVVASFDKK